MWDLRAGWFVAGRAGNAVGTGGLYIGLLTPLCESAIPFVDVAWATNHAQGPYCPEQRRGHAYGRSLQSAAVSSTLPPCQGSNSAGCRKGPSYWGADQPNHRHRRAQAANPPTSGPNDRRSQGDGAQRARQGRNTGRATESEAEKCYVTGGCAATAGSSCHCRADDGEAQTTGQDERSDHY